MLSTYIKPSRLKINVLMVNLEINSWKVSAYDFYPLVGFAPSFISWYTSTSEHKLYNIVTSPVLRLIREF